MGKLGNAALILATVGAIVLCLFAMDAATTDRLGVRRYWLSACCGPDAEVAQAQLYLTPKQHELRSEYPELFATDGIVIIFGADWCRWCKAQAQTCKAASFAYNIIYAEIEDSEGNPTRWKKLMDHMELGRQIPVTVVIEKGEKVKTFFGFTPWNQIKPFAAKAKKSVDKTDGNQIEPLDVDDSNPYNTDDDRYERRRDRQ